jgi:formylglycine-generating enzyme required for sulfatase activity
MTAISSRLRISWTFLALLGMGALGLASCGGSGGSSNSLSQSAGVELSGYAVVDLNTGAVQSQDSIPDLLTNPAYRTNEMVFRAVPAGSCVRGQTANTFGAQVDETPGTITMSRFYIGVFDVTQGQWAAIAGSTNTPWSATAAQGIAGTNSSDPAKPVFNVSRDQVNTALSLAQGRLTFPVALPSSDQWEYACRAGTSTVFSWGDLDATPAATASTYAVVNETAQGQLGPQIVGSHTANAFGLYDMLGNVWQWTDFGTGEIRGGSWKDSLAQARCANKAALDHTVSHVLVGFRLVLTP